MRFRILILSGLVGSIGSLSLAGTKIAMEFSTVGEQEKAVGWIYLSPGLVRIDGEADPDSGEAESTILYDAARDRIVLLDHTEQSYFVIDSAAVERIRRQVEESHKAEEGLTPEDKELLRKARETLDSGKPTLEALETENGVKHYTVHVGDEKRLEFWTVDPASQKVSPEEFQLLRRLALGYRDYLRAASSEAFLVLGNRLMLALVLVEEMPRRILDLADHSEIRLLAGVPSDQPDSFFAVPSDYDEVVPGQGN